MSKAPFFLVLLAAWVAVSSAESFNPGRMRLLDYVHFPTSGNFNLLFRGNNPEANGKFLYNELIAQMANVTANATGGKVAFPKDFYLIDMSFLVGIDPKESGDLALEKSFWSANPHLGELINWPLLGNLMNPNSVGHSLRKSMAKDIDHWTTDKMGEKVPTLRSLLTTARNTSVVIYIHCEAGVDRTGEMSANYLMEYKNMTYKTVMAIDDGIEPRPIAKASEHGVMWYCLYLLWAKGQQGLGCPSA